MSATVVTEELFGQTKKGEQVKKYRLSNTKCNIEAEVITYGATLTSLTVPDKHGGVRDISLGFDDIEGYEGNPYMGAVCGRVANRIGKASFTHNGQQYKLNANDGINHLHGGIDNWSMAVWNARVEGGSVILSHTSEDGDQGYPGKVTAYATYTVTDDSELIIKFSATTDKTTPIDLTSHGYYNLAGESHGSIKDHTVTIHANHYLEVEKEKSLFLIPTGKIASVESTPFDLRKPTQLGEAMAKVPVGGYMHNFCLNGPTGRRKAARISDPESGIVMELYTDQQGLIFYTSDYVNVSKGKSGRPYSKHSAFCVQTQGFGDAVNHDNFPDPFLEPGSEYQHTVWHKFGIDKL